MNILDAQTWLSERWADCLARAVESMTGERPEVSVNSAPYEQPPSQDGIQWTEQLSLGSDVTVGVIVPPETWRDIGQAALRAAGAEPSDAQSVRATFVEMLRQALRDFAHEIGKRLDQEVSCEGQRPTAPPSSASRFDLTLASGSRELGFAVSPRLVKLLQDTAAFESDAAPEGALELATAKKSRTLDLLLDVELPISVSFGRAQVPLKDVVRLTSGSIVELNRMVSEPVEVIVNNCVIARGEVVVVEGNYGVRIQQIVSRQERLRTLT